VSSYFDDTFCCHAVPETEAKYPPSQAMALRPQSMPDFTALMESSASLFESAALESSSLEKRIHHRRQTSPERRAHHMRKKPSISLAAGLMMNTESPLASGLLGSAPLSPRKRSRSRPGPAEESSAGEHDEGANLFYAYALRSDYPASPPYILTFASAAVCAQWWHLVHAEYPCSARPSPQFFVVRSEDMERLQDDARFFDMRNKWFYTSQDSPTCPPIVIPLQHASGVPLAAHAPPAAVRASTPAMDSLAESLARLAGVVESNAEQVHALSVAQSAGLQAMQEICESNGTQIKALSDSHIRLQALVDQNASHYIALSNQSFQSQERSRQAQEQTRTSQEQTRTSQEQTTDILKATMSQLQALSKNQRQLSQSCDAMMRSIETIGNSMSHFTSHALSDTASNQSLSAGFASNMSPAPRKLNRRVKGVWYEYDSAPSPSGTPRRRIDAANVDTPPKSPVVFKRA
jgi:hypothetical protein